MQNFFADRVIHVWNANVNFASLNVLGTALKRLISLVFSVDASADTDRCSNTGRCCDTGRCQCGVEYTLSWSTSEAVVPPMTSRFSILVSITPSFSVLYCTHTHTHTQPFNGRLSGDYPGRPVPEETFTRSHPSWSAYFLYHLSPLATVHGVSEQRKKRKPGKRGMSSAWT